MYAEKFTNSENMLMQMKARIAKAAKQTATTFLHMFPILFGVLALASLLNAAMPLHMITEALPMEGIFGPVVAALIGSVAAGHPLTSYVLGGEFQAAGIGLATVAAFLVSWVTVGIVQLPTEIFSLGKRFALFRCVFCFFSSIAIAYLMAFTLRLLST